MSGLKPIELSAPVIIANSTATGLFLTTSVDAGDGSLSVTGPTKTRIRKCKGFVRVIDHMEEAPSHGGVLVHHVSQLIQIVVNGVLVDVVGLHEELELENVDWFTVFVHHNVWFHSGELGFAADIDVVSLVLPEIITDVEVRGGVHVALVEDVMVPKVAEQEVVETSPRESVEPVEIETAHITSGALAVYL